MWKKQVKSKVYIQKKTNNVLIVILSLCIIIIAIVGITSIVSNGPKVGNISPMIIALVVGVMVLDKSKIKDRYNFDIATISIGKQLIISYNDLNLTITFGINEVFLLQYSDQLKCLRIVGNYEKKINHKIDNITNDEFLFYVGDGEEIEIIEKLEIMTNLKVQYMDR